MGTCNKFVYVTANQCDILNGKCFGQHLIKVIFAVVPPRTEELRVTDVILTMEYLQEELGGSVMEGHR